MANVLYDALFAPHAQNDRDFLILPDGSTLAYHAFVAEIARLAGALVALGVEPGDRVVVQAPKSARALALYGACVQSGAVLLPLNTAYTAAEVDYFVGDAQARVLVCDPA
ncbi:MAG: AMP-binding protein, partial [Gemmatimonadales bacterium]|nr:AMP-binding protein [Gemmatimonadales bacterium]